MALGCLVWLQDVKQIKAEYNKAGNGKDARVGCGCLRCRHLQALGGIKWLGAMRLIRLLLVLILIVHWLTCAWHYLFEQLPGMDSALDNDVGGAGVGGPMGPSSCQQMAVPVAVL